jgi:hypothetical protein
VTTAARGTHISFWLGFIPGTPRYHASKGPPHPPLPPPPHLQRPSDESATERVTPEVLATGAASVNAIGTAASPQPATSRPTLVGLRGHNTGRVRRTRVLAPSAARQHAVRHGSSKTRLHLKPPCKRGRPLLPPFPPPHHVPNLRLRAPDFLWYSQMVSTSAWVRSPMASRLGSLGGEVGREGGGGVRERGVRRVGRGKRPRGPPGLSFGGRLDAAFIQPSATESSLRRKNSKH